MMEWKVATARRTKWFKAGCEEEALQFARAHAQKLRAGWFQLFDHDNKMVTMERVDG